MHRISKIEHGLLIALTSSLRSEDPFTKVGVALENHHGRIVAVGYNGLKEGQRLDFDISNLNNRIKKNNFFIHAETNALSLVKKGEIKIAYLTHSPCVPCCQNLAANGIVEIYFLKEYNKEYIGVLDSYGIKFNHIQNPESQILKELKDKIL